MIKATLNIFFIILYFSYSNLIFAKLSNKINIFYEGRFRIIESNGAPNHKIVHTSDNKIINLKEKKNKS